MKREVRLLSIRLDNLSEGEALERMERFLWERGPHQVVTVNPEFAVLAQDQSDFRQALLRADLALADGVGLVWASWLLGRPLRARLPGVELVLGLCQRAARSGHPVFFLGAAEGVAELAAARLVAQWPGLQVAGVFAGSSRPEEEDALVSRIRAAAPDLLFVAFGAPEQDLWIARLKERLHVPLMMGVGGSFDYLSGHVRRAPPLLRRLGLEWLFRLARQPWRWRRQFTRLPRFVLLVLLQAFRERRAVPAPTPPMEGPP